MKMILWVARLAMLVFVVAVTPVLAAQVAPAAGATADARFKSIYSTEWAWRTGQAGISASGESQPNSGRLDDVDAASQQQRLAYWKDVLKQLDGVAFDDLSPANRVNYAVYRSQIENFIADQRFQTWQMPFNSDSAFWSDVGYALNGDHLRTVQDYRDYLDRLSQIPAYFDQQIANMQLGLKRGFSVPQAVLKGRDASIAAVAELKDPTQSSFYEPFKSIPATVTDDQAQALQGQALQRIRDEVIPAYAKLLTFFRQDYVPHARTTLAAEALPDGKAFYRQQIREYTTLDLGPDEIHQIGLDQVAKIHAQMLSVMADSGFQGDFPAFLAFLRSDPQFYAKTPAGAADAQRLGGQGGGRQTGTLLRSPAAGSASPSSRCRTISRRTTPPAAAVRTSIWSTPTT